MEISVAGSGSLARNVGADDTPLKNVFFACRACGEMHDPGKCPMEEFYNMIRQWYVLTKHAGMLPEKAEKMLN
uniref:Metal-binding protein n=1 Tax=Peronospora matthiolae TaxID=2874970 RepID=A0AAV1TZA4_9STRA